MVKTQSKSNTKRIETQTDGKSRAAGEPESVRHILERQKEFGDKGMKPDACGRAVQALIEADKRLKAGFKGLKDERALAQDKVIDELKKANRTSVTVDGYTAMIVHIEEQDKIKLKSPRLNAEA